MWRTNLKVLAVALIVIGFYTSVAHIIPQLQSEVPEELSFGATVTSEALVAAGEKLYNGAGGCTACHGLGTQAPNLLTDHAGQGTIGARCASREPGKDCKIYLYESLTNPAAYVVSGFGVLMTDMRRQFPEDQIWALVAFLQSHGGEVTVTGADLPKTPAAGAGGAGGAAGAGGTFTATLDPKQLITEKGCIACHTLDGSGGPVGPSFDGIGGRVNADRIRRGIVDPGVEAAKGFEHLKGAMPAIFATQLSAAQLEALVHFLAARK